MGNTFSWTNSNQQNRQAYQEPRHAVCATPPPPPMSPAQHPKSPALSSGHCSARVPSKVEHPPAENWTNETEPMIEDVQLSFHNVASMIPPSVPNTLQEFLRGVAEREIVPAMCHRDTRVDAAKYWEKRRVQNLLRRMLESLQERFGFEESSAPQDSDFGGVGYDAIARWAAQRAGSSSGLDEQSFLSALEVMDAWPPELGDGDRREVFLALLATSGAVKALAAGKPLPKQLTKRMFCEGLSRVPFNVPDFPVPLHLLNPSWTGTGSPSRGPSPTKQQVSEAARSIASVFCREQTGLDRIKDFFLSGLLSLEEIQMAVPKLQKASIIEEAVVRIIRTSARHFTKREWHSLVVSVWTPEAIPPDQEQPTHMHGQQCRAEKPVHQACHEQRTHHEPQLCRDEQGFVDEHHVQPSPRPQSALPSLSSPTHVYRTLEGEDVGSACVRSANRSDSRKRHEEEQCHPESRVPQTEPLPPRELLSEEPLQFMHAGRTESVAQVFEPSSSFIDWSAPSRALAGEVCRTAGVSVSCSASGGGADEGAGTSRGGVEKDGDQHDMNGVDPVSWISVEFHSECKGPFLARAFVRCCQLYEASQG